MVTAEPAPKPKKTWVLSGTLFQKEFGKKPSKTIWKGKMYEGPAFKAFIEGKREMPTGPRSLADRILGRGREPGTVKLGHEITQLDVGGAFRSRAPFKLYKELDTRIGPFANEVKLMDAIDKFMGTGGDESRRDKQTGEPLNKRQIVMHNMLSAAGVEDADAIVSKIKFETGQDSTVWTSEKFVNKLLDIRCKHYRGWVPLGRLMYEHRGEIGKTINEVITDAAKDGTLDIDRYPSGGPREGEGRVPITPRPGARREGRRDALEHLMETQGIFERMDREGMPRRIREPIVGGVHGGMFRKESEGVTIVPKRLMPTKGLKALYPGEVDERNLPVLQAAVDDWRKRGSGSRYGEKGKPKYFYPPGELKGESKPTEEEPHFKVVPGVGLVRVREGVREVALPLPARGDWVDRRTRIKPKDLGKFFKSKWYTDPGLVAEYRKFVKAGGTFEQWEQRVEKRLGSKRLPRKPGKGQRELADLRGEVSGKKVEVTKTAGPAAEWWKERAEWTAPGSGQSWWRSRYTRGSIRGLAIPVKRKEMPEGELILGKERLRRVKKK